MAVEERTPVTDRAHRVHWFAGRVHEVLDEVTAGGVRTATLSPAETLEATRELSAAIDRMQMLRLSLLAHGHRLDVAAEVGATSTGAWLAHTTRTPHGQAYALVRLAQRLETDRTATAEALLAGRVSLDQARVVVEAIDALPAWVGAEDRARAEKHLLVEGGDHDATRLKVLARHLLHVIDPDAADTHLAHQLAKEEDHATRTTMFTLHDDGHGTCHGRFKLPALHGAMLATALNALASPKRPDPISRHTPGEATEAIEREVLDPGTPHASPVRLVPRAPAEILGEAFCQLLERLDPTRLPTAGGVNATVIVTLDLATLQHPETGPQPGYGVLDTGQEITAGTARRLACEAGIIPAVLGTRSEILDLGRKTRLHPPSHRLAIRLRDKTCTAEGCDIPAAWCHTHHKKPWAHGGHTSVQDGTTLCPRHHHMVHHPAYTVEYLPHGKTRITKTTRRRRP